MQQIKQCWQILIDRSLESKVLVFSIPEGMRSSRRSSSRENPIPSPVLCPCESVSGTQPIAVYLDPFAEAAGIRPAGSSTADVLQCKELTAAEDAEAARLSLCCVHEPWYPCRSEPRVQDPEVSIKGKRNEASRVWRHSHITPLHGVKLAQVTTLCQNGSRLCWLCQSQVKAGICSQEDGGSHLILAAAVVGSSMAHWGPGSSVRVLSAPPCLAGPQHPSTSQ